MRYLSLLVVFAFFSTPSYGQFGKLGKKLKEKAEDVVKDALVEKTDEKQAEYDTTTFNYAIAFLDKSESFENKQKGEGIIKTTNFLLKDQEDKSDEETARNMYEFGRLNYLRRSYRLAEVYLLAALASFELLGTDNEPLGLKTSGLLGLLYADMGRFNQAELFTQQALTGWKESMGNSSPGYIAEFNNMAVLKMKKGQYGESEKDLKQTVDQVKAIEGEESVPHAITLNNLGILYVYMGRIDEALDLLDRSLQIAEEDLRQRSGTYLQLMTNKALVLQENQQYEKAEETYLEALDLQKSRLKLNAKSDPDYAHMLNNLASLYVVTGRAEKAEALLIESLDIYRKKFEEEHPTTVAAKADLGNLYRYQGKYSKALGYLLDAYESRKGLFGEDHPVTTQSVEDLAVLKWKLGQIDEAAKLFSQSLDFSLEFINEFFPSLSEIEKTQYWNQLKPRFYTYFNFAFENHKEKPDLLARALTYRVATKGLLLNSSTKIKNTILSSGDPDLIDLYNRWTDQKKSLAVYYGLSREELNEQKINIDSLEREANESERRLSEKSSLFATDFVDTDVSYDQLQNSLTSGQAIVEMIQFPVYENYLTPTSAYAAFIIRKGDKRPILVKLDDEGNLDKKYYAVYKNLIRLKADDQYSYENFWKPVQQQLEPVSTVFFCPDGVYNQVNVATLKAEDGTFILEKQNTILKSNPKDLLVSKAGKSANKEAFLLGFPTYGSDQIASLPGTRAEVESIKASLLSARLNVEMNLQKEASEIAIKRVKNPRIMHIATHGFFLEDKDAGKGVFGVEINSAAENPLLRSGLILAGAAGTQSSYTGQSFEEEDNGILTAYEAVNLDLTSTDLVVLSACETGKGDIQSGEGVYGLQRAFAIAGADKLIMSLWKVDDEATQQLMSDFYRNWTASNMSPEEAFRKAQLNLASTYESPYYWGAFVMVD